MSNAILSVDFIEESIARSMAAEIKGTGLMKRIARGLAHSTVTSISKQLSESDGRTPLQLRTLLMLRETAPGVFHKVWVFLCRMVGYSAAPERSPDGMKIEIRGQLDQVEIAFLEVKKAAIRAAGTGLAPMDRKVVRGRIKELQSELDEFHQALDVRPVVSLYDALEM